MSTTAPRRTRHIAPLVAATLVTAGLASCSRSHDEAAHRTEEARVVYRDGGGPLGGSPSEPGGSGGVSLDPPDNSVGHWFGTFGSMILCSRTGSPITVQGVSFEFSGAPVPVSAVVRNRRSQDEVGETSPSGPRKVDRGISILPAGSSRLLASK